MRWQDTSYLKFLMTYHVTRLVPHDLPKFQTGNENNLEMSPKLHREASVKRFRMFVSVSVFLFCSMCQNCDCQWADAEAGVAQ